MNQERLMEAYRNDLANLKKHVDMAVKIYAVLEGLINLQHHPDHDTVCTFMEAMYEAGCGIVGCLDDAETNWSYADARYDF